MPELITTRTRTEEVGKPRPIIVGGSFDKAIGLLSRVRKAASGKHG